MLMTEEDVQIRPVEQLIELKKEILKTKLPNLEELTLHEKYLTFLTQGYLLEIELNKLHLEVYKALTKDKCEKCNREPIYKTEDNTLLCWNHSIE
jgi:hypothetical protein